MFLNNRYYDPGLGNFVSVDPLVGQTGTPYLYANGNPVTLSDPSGLCAGLEEDSYWGQCFDGSALDSEGEYQKAAGGDGTDLQTVVDTLGIGVGGIPGGVAGELWGQLADLGWSYFQKLNFFYWMHRLVQAHLAATVPGAEMEWNCTSGGGSRADVCRYDEYVEIKPVGRDDEGWRQLQRFLKDLMDYSGRQGWSAYASDWPAGGQIGVPGTPLSVTYAKSAVYGAGVYTWFYSGGTLPNWNDWKVKQREQVRAYETSLTTVSANSGGFNWKPWAWVAIIGIGLAEAAKCFSPSKLITGACTA